MDSRDFSPAPAAAASSETGRDGSVFDDDAVLSVTSALAKDAVLPFQSGKFAECIDVLNQLKQKKENDPKVFHNIAIAEFFRDGCLDPKKLLEALNCVKVVEESETRRKQDTTSNGLENLSLDSCLGEEAEIDFVTAQGELLGDSERGRGPGVSLHTAGLSAKAGMNLSPFKRDIDELIGEFVKVNSMTFADMKTVWLSRKFSYIYEAGPTNNLSFFMQSLYAHTIEELAKLKDLIVEAKDKGIEVAAAVAKQMVEKKMFIFGSVDLSEASAAEKINQLTQLQNARVRIAHEKLFADAHIEQYLHLDMGKEVDLDNLKKISTEYAEAKKRAIEGASEVVDVQDIKHLSEEKELIGERVEKLKKDWEAQRQSFYQQTRLNYLATVQSQPPPPPPPPPKQEEGQHNDEGDGFDELEQLVFQC